MGGTDLLLFANPCSIATHVFELSHALFAAEHAPFVKVMGNEYIQIRATRISAIHYLKVVASKS